MDKAIVELPQIKPNSLAILGEKTPPEKIKKRPGAGGMVFSYVEIGYVVAQLDKAFNRLWEFEILDQQVGNDQIWVKGRLTVHLAPNFSLKKDSFGSSEIKKYAAGAKMGMPIDIGNDMKSAQSDALKKAASLLGVAQDVYYPKEYEN